MPRLSNNFSSLLVLVLAVPAIIVALDPDFAVTAAPYNRMQRRSAFLADAAIEARDLAELGQELFGRDLTDHEMTLVQRNPDFKKVLGKIGHVGLGILGDIIKRDAHDDKEKEDKGKAKGKNHQHECEGEAEGEAKGKKTKCKHKKVKGKKDKNHPPAPPSDDALPPDGSGVPGAPQDGASTNGKPTQNHRRAPPPAPGVPATPDVPAEAEHQQHPTHHTHCHPHHHHADNANPNGPTGPHASLNANSPSPAGAVPAAANPLASTGTRAHRRAPPTPPAPQESGATPPSVPAHHGHCHYHHHHHTGEPGAGGAASSLSSVPPPPGTPHTDPKPNSNPEKAAIHQRAYPSGHNDGKPPSQSSAHPDTAPDPAGEMPGHSTHTSGHPHNKHTHPHTSETETEGESHRPHAGPGGASGAYRRFYYDLEDLD